MNTFPKWALAFTVLSTLTAFADVSVSSPSNGATVGSPVHVVASASAASGIAAIRVWVDDNSVYLAYSSSIDTSVPMSQGAHYVVVQAWDNYGNASKQVMTVNVAGSATPTSATGNWWICKCQFTHCRPDCWVTYAFFGLGDAARSISSDGVANLR